MASLIPTISRSTAVDLNLVFHSDQTKTTRERAVAFLRAAFQANGDLSVDMICKPDTVTEEVRLDMPTRDAYNAGVDLCRAIVAHSERKISDIEMKGHLVLFLNAHTFVYETDNSRRLKAGSWQDWTGEDVPLFSIEFDGIFFGDTRRGYICNLIQREIFIAIFGKSPVRDQQI